MGEGRGAGAGAACRHMTNPPRNSCFVFLLFFTHRPGEVSPPSRHLSGHFFSISTPHRFYPSVPFLRLSIRGNDCAAVPPLSPQGPQAAHDEAEPGADERRGRGHHPMIPPPNIPPTAVSYPVIVLYVQSGSATCQSHLSPPSIPPSRRHQGQRDTNPPGWVSSPPQGCRCLTSSYSRVPGPAPESSGVISRFRTLAFQRHSGGKKQLLSL